MVETWEKVLYRKQGFQDNHTPETFLNQLVLNRDVRPRHYWRVVHDAAGVTQQASIAVSVASLFTHGIRGNLDLWTILAIDAALLVCGCACREVLNLLSLTPLQDATPATFPPRDTASPRPTASPSASLLDRLVILKPSALKRRVRRVWQLLLLVGGLYLMSPLLQTLTATISEDTLIATVVASLLFHLFLHDYYFLNSITTKLTGSTALGAAIFASVLLASRLSTPALVFALMLFALELFLLSPYLRRDIKKISGTAHLVLSAAMFAAGTGLVGTLSGLLAGVFVALCAFLTVLCPLYLVHIMKFKNQMNGPWDEAVPKVVLQTKCT